MKISKYDSLNKCFGQCAVYIAKKDLMYVFHILDLFDFINLCNTYPLHLSIYLI